MAELAGECKDGFDANRDWEINQVYRKFTMIITYLRQ